MSLFGWKVKPSIVVAIGVLFVLAGCPLGLFSSKPEAKVKGLWVVAEKSNSYLWYYSLSFIVYYFDGKGNIASECQKLWGQGWDANEMGCYRTSGKYSVEGDVIIIETPLINERYSFKRVGDKLFLSKLGDTRVSGTFTLIKDYPWNTYKDTSRFIKNGKVDASFFSGYMNPQ